MTIERIRIPDLFANPLMPHAVVHGGVAYLSGVLGTVDGAGAIPDDIEDEIEACLRNVITEAEGAGSAAGRLLSVTVYLADLSHGPLMNSVWDRVLPRDARPARATIGSLLPAGMRIEITAVAAVG